MSRKGSAAAVLRDALSLVMDEGELPSVSKIASWTPAQRRGGRS